MPIISVLIVQVPCHLQIQGESKLLLQNKRGDSTHPDKHFLNATYPARWIGHGGPVAWPPRSLNFNPLDFFFWGHMKSLVNEMPVDSAEDLVARINVAADKINTPPGTLERVC
ncbi:hypothetical protein AVEN_51170-1 [Araneus ventricosus]|uniref:Uncharacterized protein n=1 Tax=Araneus ventricosus TaxID=182803 RepID=A0A4Y2N717_ARAVE|nr:hypothetical protein AVEN_51170-1 [Araneus ventricosus]